MTGYSEAEPLYDQMGISLLLGDLVRLVLANARWAGKSVGLMLFGGPKEAAPMAKSPKTKRKKPPKTVLKLPDLEQSKSAVLSSLASEFAAILQ
jgi:hypothetical protein